MLQPRLTSQGGSKVSLETSKMWPPELVRMAVERDMDKKVTDFINSNDLSDVTECTGLSLLHKAAVCGNYVMVDYFIEAGWNVDEQDDCGCTPLLLAAKQGYFKAVNTLLAANANIYLSNKKGMNVVKLVGSNTYNEWNILKAVLEKVRGLKISDELKLELLMRSEWSLSYIMAMKNNALTRLAIHNGVNVNHKDRLGKTALHRAVRSGDLLTTIQLLNSGADVNAKDCNGCTPVSNVFLTKRFHDVLAILVAHGSNVYDLDFTGKMQCFNLFSYGCYDAIAELRLDFSVQDSFGNTILHYLANNRDPTVIQKICGEYIDVHVRNSKGESPLHVAAKLGNVRFFGALVKRNADPNLKDNAGKTPTFYLKKAVSADVFEEVSKELLSVKKDSKMLYSSVVTSGMKKTSASFEKLRIC